MQVKISPPIEVIRSHRKRAIAADREESLQSGFEFEGRRYQLGAKSQAEIAFYLAATAADIQWPDNFAWRTAENEMVPMDEGRFLRFAAAALRHKARADRLLFDLKDKIESSSTPESIHIPQEANK